jgi:HlyD family secretion protein
MSKEIRAVTFIMMPALMLVLVLSGCGNGQREGIQLSGNIELTQVDLAFKAPGKLAELNVREGSTVKKGDVIARLDTQELMSRRDAARAVMMAAESRLAQLRTAIRYQEENVEGNLDRTRAESRQADAMLAQLQAGSRSQEIAQAQAAVDAAQTEATRAAADWERAQTLYRNEDISRAQFDQYRTRHEAAEASLRQALERLDLVKEGPRKEDIEGAKAQVARSRAGIRLAEAARIELDRTRQEVAARQADIEQARAQLAVLETQLQDAVLVSPIDGVVLVKSTEPGEVVAAGTNVVTVGDIENPWLRAYINQTDLGRVKLGDEVEITTDSFPGKTYKGRVSFIASEAEFTPKQIQTREERVKLVYRIKVEVPNPQHELKLNMPAEAVIPLDRS